MCQDSHHHNFFLYSRSLKKNENECLLVCLHASIACTLWLSKGRERDGRGEESWQVDRETGRAQVWLFVDVFQDNDCGQQFFLSVSLVLHSYSLLFSFYATIYILLCLWHTSQIFLLWMISVNISSLCVCMCMADVKQYEEILQFYWW